MARGGIYVREANAWIVFLVFKGTDIHSGFAPSEDPLSHQEWVESHLSAAWDHAGPENRQGYVIYPSTVATKRNAGMNMTPTKLFGNFGAAQPHRTTQRTFSDDGFVSLGGLNSWANRMGREAVLEFYNNLCLSNLDLNIDLDALIQSITYKSINEDNIALLPLPYHPIKDSALIKQYISYYAYLQYECTEMHVQVNRSNYKGWQKEIREQRKIVAQHNAFHPTERPTLIMPMCPTPLHPAADANTNTNADVSIVEVLRRQKKGDKVLPW